MKNRGFTSIELLVVAAILAMVIAIGMQLFFSRNQAEQSLMGKLTLQSDARKAADMIIARVREGAEIIRPFLGETRNYMVYLDGVNNTCMIYMTEDVENTQKFKRPLYKLISYTHNYTGSGFQPMQEKVLGSSLQRVAFTTISPNSVQVTATIANEKSEFQFVTHAGLLNFGGAK
ncbi:MAG TPA: prepilin-type N-terminal cleavage/methylation domain-containing protein [Candidatus Ozemobacteraceae bacterium]|nr:prepilin-type N-terminal cleavage/methylation domain-containing protein [Candidatus Ozemobacteraceae bacterium]